MKKYEVKTITRVIMGVIITLALNGCGGGGGDAAKNSNSPKDKSSSKIKFYTPELIVADNKKYAFFSVRAIGQGSVLYTLSGKDADAFTELEYSDLYNYTTNRVQFEHLLDYQIKKINRHTQTFASKKALDSSVKDSYDITITATDSKGNSVSKDFIIKVSSYNSGILVKEDYRFKFRPEIWNKPIKQTQTFIGQTSVHDNLKQNKIVYEILPGDSNDISALIEAKSTLRRVRLFLRKPIRYNAGGNNIYSFKVKATQKHDIRNFINRDGKWYLYCNGKIEQPFVCTGKRKCVDEHKNRKCGTLEQENIQTINLEVLDSDITPPAFDASYDSPIQIKENIKVVLDQIEAQDASEVSFSLSGGKDKDLFEINDGELSFKSPFGADFEKPEDNNTDNTYEIQIKAEDEDGNAADKNITVQVLDDTQDAMPYFKDVSADVKTYENKTEVFAPQVVWNVKKADGNQSKLKYSLLKGGEDFKIDAHTGWVYFKTTPDFESAIQKEWDIKIQARDEKDASKVASKDFTIELEDVQEGVLKTGQHMKSFYKLNSAKDIKEDAYWASQGIGAKRMYSRHNDIVTDLVTGLKWQDNEIKPRPSAGIYIKDDLQGAKQYCENLTLGGLEWRLPTIDELETIIDYSEGEFGGSGCTTPAHSATYDCRYITSEKGTFNKIFKHIFHDDGDKYWSSTSLYDNNSRVLVIEFKEASSAVKYDDENYYFKCVSGTKLENTTPVVENGIVDGIATKKDPQTGLIWEDSPHCEDKRQGYSFVNRMPWDNARAYCESLGNRWRLPNINEVMSILSDRSKQPSIKSGFTYNPTMFSTIWSSTTKMQYFDPNFGFGGQSRRGTVKTYRRTGTYGKQLVRCVKGDGLK